MQNPEALKLHTNPEVNLDDLKVLINQVKFESGRTYIFNGNVYNLIMFPEDGLDENNVDAWYSASTAVQGYDIYILETLSLKEKKIRLFHEILEIDLKLQKIPHDQAHAMAKDQEQYF